MKVLGFDTGTAIPRHTAWRRFIDELPLHHPLGSLILTTRNSGLLLSHAKAKPPREEDVRARTSAAVRQELLQSAGVHLGWLSRALGMFPHAVRLVDREGAILQVEGDQRSSEAMGQPARTNPDRPGPDMEGADTAMAWDNCVVVAPEDEASGALTTIAVPLHDREGEIVAAIDVTAEAVHMVPEHLLLVAQTAMAIEQHVEARAGVPVAVPDEPGGASIATMSVRREKERLAKLLEAAPVITYVTDANERILYMSERGRAEWGGGTESLVGKSLQEIFSEDTARALSANSRTVRQAKTAMQFEETADHGGRLRHYLSVKVPLRTFDNRPNAVSVIAIDITGRKQMDQKAAEYARQVSELVEAALALFASHSVRSVLRAVADAARRLVGGDRATTSIVSNEDVGRLLQASSVSDVGRSASAEEATRQGPVDALVYRVSKPVRLAAEQAADRAAWSIADSQQRTDGGMRGWLAVPLLCEGAGNGGLIQIWHGPGKEFSEADEAVIVQLARLAEVAIRNAAAHDELQRSDRRKDEFLALLGHELRNPLAPIRNATRLLGETQGRHDNVQFARSVIERQVDQMTRMVDDLLDMSRIASGRFVFQKQPVRLIDVINRAVETCSPLFDAKRQTLSLSGPDQETWIDADSGRLAQVLANLLNNASKFTPEEGIVSLRFERRGTEGVITVADTGKGIPAGMLKQIFGLFVQVERPEAGGPGLGLGLWLARNLVELHGGHISARSEGLGNGSEFAVTLPLLATPPMSTPSEAHIVTSARDGASKGCQVLIVDDNKDSADSIALFLGGEGCDVRVAYNGAAALEVTSSWSPDIVFLDIALPDMPGYAVAQKMRARETTKKSAMIAVTGWGRQRDRDKTRAAGFDEHLVKPVDPSAVLALVNARARRVVDEAET